MIQGKEQIYILRVVEADMPYAVNLIINTRKYFFRCPAARHSRPFPYIQFRICLFMFYINNSLHLARKYARIFVRGNYLFREANSFPRAKLEENCELRGTDNIQGQIPVHIFVAKWMLLCFIILQIFFFTRLRFGRPFLKAF